MNKTWQGLFKSATRAAGLEKQTGSEIEKHVQQDGAWVPTPGEAGGKPAGTGSGSAETPETVRPKGWDYDKVPADVKSDYAGKGTKRFPADDVRSIDTSLRSALEEVTRADSTSGDESDWHAGEAVARLDEARSSIQDVAASSSGPLRSSLKDLIAGIDRAINEELTTDGIDSIASDFLDLVAPAKKR